MEKDGMEKEKNIMTAIFYLKEIIYMEKDGMEKEKNIMMIIYYLKENI